MKNIWVDWIPKYEWDERSIKEYKDIFERLPSHNFIKAPGWRDGGNQPGGRFINRKMQITTIDFQWVGYYNGGFKPAEFEMNSICVRLNGKYGLLGINSLLTEIEFDNRIFFIKRDYCKNVGLAPVIKDSKIALINFDGKFVSKFYDFKKDVNLKNNPEILWDIKNEFECVSIESKYGLMRFDGKETLSCIYDKICLISNSTNKTFFNVIQNGKYGIVHCTEGEKIPCIYDKPFDESRRLGRVFANEINGETFLFDSEWNLKDYSIK